MDFLVHYSSDPDIHQELTERMITGLLESRRARSLGRFVRLSKLTKQVRAAQVPGAVLFRKIKESFRRPI